METSSPGSDCRQHRIPGVPLIFGGEITRRIFFRNGGKRETLCLYHRRDAQLCFLFSEEESRLFATQITVNGGWLTLGGAVLVLSLL